MKKSILTLAIIFSELFLCQAQEIAPNALGLRLGNNDGFGGEISYQKALKENNRLEFDLGWRNSNDVNALKLVGLYQWIWHIDEGFNWYAGAGAGLGSWSYNINGAKDSGIYALAAGDVGVEYNFDFPLQLSLDFRPEIYLNSGDWRTNNFGSDIALGIRYKW